jgi:uncharacterized membrane protein HdeD (DUF308 family)
LFTSVTKSRTWRLVVAAFFILDGVLFFIVAHTSRERSLNMVSALLFVAAGILTGISALRRKTPAKP